MPVEQFGVLKRIDLRLLWPHEALNFTTWLAQNIGVLGETLGLELELRGQEAPVGSFSLDLLAHDLGRDRSVIIENQLAPTDHDHLGKLITYAAGHAANVAVWVAPEFREEHRQALDWLNQRTDASTEFFGVVVEALQIDDSLPAPNFRLVASPNEWRKANVGAGERQASPNGEAYRAFFQGLIDRLRTQHGFTGARKAQPVSFYGFSSGIGGVSYGFNFGGGRVRAETYIDRLDRNWNKWMFNGLHAKREAIEAEFGESLEWERLDHRRASRIVTRRLGSIEDPPEVLEESADWGIDRLLRFKKVIGPKMALLLAANGPGPTVGAASSALSLHELDR
jgi:hypothetical protein